MIGTTQGLRGFFTIISLDPYKKKNDEAIVCSNKWNIWGARFRSNSFNLKDYDPFLSVTSNRIDQI
jgi:hypothetical protein